MFHNVTEALKPALPAGFWHVIMGQQPRPGSPGQPLGSGFAPLLESISRKLGESEVGAWDPEKDLPSHLKRDLEDRKKDETTKLRETLARACAGLAPAGQVLLLLQLWWDCFWLWDRLMAFRTVEVVAKAVRDLPDEAGPPSGWQRLAWRAAAAAPAMMEADGTVFAQMNLASATGLRQAAGDTEALLSPVAGKLAEALAVSNPEGHSERAVIGAALDSISSYVGQMRDYYKQLVAVAGLMGEFEDLLQRAVPHAGLPAGLRAIDFSGGARKRAAEVLRSLRATTDRLDGRPRSEIEPWVYMVAEIAALTEQAETDPPPATLIPERAWVRYCFPFAVDTDARSGRDSDDDTGGKPSAGPLPRLLQPGNDLLRDRIQEELNSAGLQQVTIREPKELEHTELFQSGRADDALFGGIRIDLPDVKLSIGRADATADPSATVWRAWLDLNWMGNFCLCVEANRPLVRPSPPRLNQVMRAGTPYAYGELVTVPDSSPPAQWDNLSTFARDIVRATAVAIRSAALALDAPKGSGGDSRDALSHFVRGIPHEIVVLKTAGPLGDQAGDITAALDRSVGGRLLLRSVHRASATVADWVRFPPQQVHPADAQAMILAVPEIGFSGDWFVQTGETTVFGLVAAPAWLSDVYPEAAQFAASWPPVLRMWGQRLQRIKVHGNTANALELRRVEYQIRQHLAQINSEELCSAHTHRRFLDALLAAANVSRLERELEGQLRASEQLADWWSEWMQQQRDNEQQRRDDRQRASDTAERKEAARREALLAVIAVFGVFSVADFLSLTDSSSFSSFQRLGIGGSWQVLLVESVFLLAALLTVIYLAVLPWLHRRKEAKNRPKKPGAAARKWRAAGKWRAARKGATG